MRKSKSIVTVISIIVFLISVTLLYAFSNKSILSDNTILIKNTEIKNNKSSDIKGKWINSDQDLSIENLKGKAVLIEFWTFECYNCKNTLPYIKDWDAKFSSDKFQVIGIHCPEFDNERKFDNVKAAVNELGIKYPVLIDNEFTVWEKYNVHAWPTIILLDRTGKVRYTNVGEGNYDKTEKKIIELMNE